jgi:hypothetical protein
MSRIDPALEGALMALRIGLLPGLARQALPAIGILALVTIALVAFA